MCSGSRWSLLKRSAKNSTGFCRRRGPLSDHFREQALEAAKRAEKEIQRGTYRGPLHGVPIGVKDLCYTKGLRTMPGTSIYANFIPDHDATVV
jgi:Asp-tRNA(Asn)/Glu-tRNA(Gln) amidotransferase A subunit family amidase